MAGHIPTHLAPGAYYRDRRTPLISEVPGNAARGAGHLLDLPGTDGLSGAGPKGWRRGDLGRNNAAGTAKLRASADRGELGASPIGVLQQTDPDKCPGQMHKNMVGCS